MPRYFYTARSQKGKPKTGTREAKNKYELARILRQQGYILISAILEEEKAKKKRLEIPIPFLGGVSLKEKIFFTRNLRIMISAGVALPQALKFLSRQTKSKKLTEVLLKIREEIIKGKSFSQALSKYPDIFPNIYYSMIKVAEKAGTLEEVLKNLTEQMEKEAKLKSEIKGAMIYPSVIIVTMIGVGILMLVMVVPKLAQTFEKLNIELPLTTKITIWLGTFLLEYWYLLLLMVLFLLILLKMVSKSRGGKRVLDSLTLKLPIVSPIIRKTNSSYTVRTLSALISAGVPIVRSLEIISEALGNIYFKKAMSAAAIKVEKGVKLSEVLEEHKNIYPSLVSQMIAVGEETGKTSEILKKLADFYEEEVTRTTKNLASIIEPVLIIIIGVVVGFFAVSMLQPMYTMLQGL